MKSDEYIPADCKCSRCTQQITPSCPLVVSSHEQARSIRANSYQNARASLAPVRKRSCHVVSSFHAAKDAPRTLIAVAPKSHDRRSCVLCKTVDPVQKGFIRIVLHHRRLSCCKRCSADVAFVTLKKHGWRGGILCKPRSNPDD